MKAQLIFGWVLAAAASATMTWNGMFAGEMFDCKKTEQSNPISTPCDECHLQGSGYMKCDSENNPIETKCTLVTQQNGVQCEEMQQDCTGDKIYYATAQDCANNHMPTRFEDGCTNAPTIGWIEATWGDYGDEPNCDGSGVE